MSTAAVAAGFARRLAAAPVVLAPMEDVTDASFRRLARDLGAELCVTEFVRAEQLAQGTALARRKATLADDDQPTAIQIYGADPARLLAAARAAVAWRPAWLDVNCGCWVPRVTRGGAGAAWLRDPTAMVAMARALVDAVGDQLAVTIKTRIGWGPESHMPIVDLARRLEDVGVAGLTIHCRTALAGHTGRADWAWAGRAAEAVRIPVIVNGDVGSADDAARALAETGAAGVMIGRAAIHAPWIVGEALARLRGEAPRPVDDAARVRLLRHVLAGHVAARGEKAGVAVTRRHLPMLGEWLTPPRRAALLAAPTVAAVEALLPC